MIVVLAIDALEYDKVMEYGCENLKQLHFGKTDISDFSKPRTMVLWSSFMTGQNKEKEVLVDGDKEMWDKKWEIKDTFFSKFRNPIVLDLPGFSYDKDVHDRSRLLLKQFFETKDKEEKEKVRKHYNNDAFEHHRKIKEDFLKALDKDHDFALGYFSIADVIGHLNFGNNLLMKMIYNDLDELAKKAAESSSNLLIISDHGMKAIGMFGDHSDYGFWSTNFRNLSNPKITDFKDVLNPDS